MPYFIVPVVALLLAAVYSFWPVWMLKKQKPAKKSAPITLNDHAAIAHLSRAISCRTISCTDENSPGFGEFVRLQSQFKEDYPNVFQTVLIHDVKPCSRLYQWKGKESGKKPILLMAHQDVVPVTPGTEKDWKYAPFEGVVAEGSIWGRGAIDMKNALCGIFEAMESLIASGFVPDRDIYVCNTCDEEIMGSGSGDVSSLCRKLGLHFEFVLDEGGSFLNGAVLGAKDRLLASVCTFEKGYCDVRLTTTDRGGHSAEPKTETALSRMARALAAIEKNKLPVDINEPFLNMYRAVAPYCDFKTKWMAAHPSRYGRLLAERLSKSSPYGNALVRTTTALTQIQGSDASSVLPQKVVANINFRIAHGFNYDALKQFVQDLAGPRFAVELPIKTNPSRPAKTDTAAFEAISQAIRQTFGEDIVVAPMVFFAGTDSRMFDSVSDNVYKFLPSKSHMLYASGMHGTNERIDVEDYLNGIRFYIRLILATCSKEA